MELKELVAKLRYRVIEYRIAEKKEGTSLHINTIDIALGLVDYALERKRQIRKEEEGWFEGGHFLGLMLDNSEWADIVEQYCEIAYEVKKRGYFR